MSEQLGVQDVTAAYRRAGQELARDQGMKTAGVVHVGTLAEAGRRRELGLSSAATVGEAVLELCCGDALADRAARELDALAGARMERWIHVNWEFVRENVDQLQEVQQLLGAEASPSQAERCMALSAAGSVSMARDSTTASVAYASAVAVARVRLAESWFSMSADDRDVYLVETICGDPVWATAAAELDEDTRSQVRVWVYRRWDAITEASAVTETVAAALGAEPTAEQRIEGLRREVRMRLREVDLPAAQVAYGAAAAEGLARWRDRGGDEARADLIMDGWALGDPTVAGRLDGVSTESRAQLRQLVRVHLAMMTRT
ncbi:hypothetical protein PJI74_01325 [Mycobacterium kansasii]